jgi:hypothetical protein
VFAQLGAPSHLIKMTIDDYMRALERAWAAALPGREAAARDAVLRELQRRLEAASRAAPARSAARLRLVVRPSSSP